MKVKFTQDTAYQITEEALVAATWVALAKRPSDQFRQVTTHSEILQISSEEAIAACDEVQAPHFAGAMSVHALGIRMGLALAEGVEIDGTKLAAMGGEA